MNAYKTRGDHINKEENISFFLTLIFLYVKLRIFGTLLENMMKKLVL